MPLIEIRISVKKDDEQIVVLDKIEGSSIIEVANKFTLACLQLIELLKPDQDFSDDDIPF